MVVARRVGGIVVHVQDVQGRTVEQVDAAEAGAALVEMINVGQDARVLVAALDGDQGGLAQPTQRLREAPDLDLRDDADSFPEVQQRAIALGHGQQGNVAPIGGPGGRSGDALAADLLHHVHAAPRVLQPFLALGVVVHDPLRKIDGALDAQTAIGDAFAQIFQVTADP